MPQALILTRTNLIKKIKALNDSYSEDILKKSHNLYMYCFTKMHSYEIHDLKDKTKNLIFPFIKNGSREFPMIYVYLLYKMLKEKNSDDENLWEYAIFIIYLTYYTDLDFHSYYLKNIKNELDTNTLNWFANEQDTRPENSSELTGYTARGFFRETFHKVKRFNFDKQTRGEYSTKFKDDIIRKIISFEKKYTNDEQVDLFVNYSMKIIISH